MSAPGWYPDPSDPSRQRYFDGRAWTENYAPLAAAPPGVGQPAKTGMSRGMKIGLGIGAAVLVLIALGSIGNSDKTSSTSSETGTTTRTVPVPPASPGTVDVAPTTTEPPKPDFTSAQENAIAKAESYLDFTGFSKQGLITQLEFDQFSTADATFAVEHLEANGSVDWNEQAVKKAKSYLDFTSFSLSGLVTQLEFDGFTPAQAQHGANIAYGG
ncbi:hypothetical protein DQP55_04200 [Mycolicibacterium sp. GF69]|uniref:Ltp family lipoprotein n=1 Tax=Mycolicibacterium sp. GF69 TaxID=2267251 RepID=UPI000DCDAE4E|nr:Ltp family lipoprotein [Mycolicibacterium sp. GF69]RAV17193.1 hypothetical protein DQP55_04200 [Mycolicibacterium sp. GF69]